MEDHMHPNHWKATREGKTNETPFNHINNEDRSHIFYEVSPTGNSLLHIAAIAGKKEIAELLMNHFPFLISKKNNDKNTALHLAATANKRDDEGLVAGKLETVSVLLRFVKQGDELLKHANDKGNTALHEALLSLKVVKKEVEDKLVSLARFLVSADPDVCFLKNEMNKSPLALAVEAGNMDALEYILVTLNNGRHKKFDKQPDAILPVRLAIENKNIDMLKMINEKLPNLLKLKDQEGNVPLHYAASVGYLPIVRLLLDYDSPAALVRNNEGLYPLHVACIKGQVSVVDKLLPVWPDLTELLDNKRRTILHCAAMENKDAVVSHVLKSDHQSIKRLIDVVDADGNTPLHLAAMHSHSLVVGLLLWDNSNSQIHNKNHQTPYKIADQLYQDSEKGKEKEETLSILLASENWYLLCHSGGSWYKRCWKVVKSLYNMTESKPLNKQDVKDRINSLMVVATIIVAGAFGAAHQMPSFDDKNPFKRVAKQVYIIFDSISMCVALMATILLCWAQITTPKLASCLVKTSSKFIAVALLTMCITFISTVLNAVNRYEQEYKIIYLVTVTFLIVIVIMLAFWEIVPPFLKEILIRFFYYLIFYCYLTFYKLNPCFIGKLS